MSKSLVDAAAQARSPRGRWLLGLLLLAAVCGGCEVNSFFDPSKTGYFGSTPVTMPILDRISAIEPSTDLWGETSAVTASDLVPSDLSYHLHPGDVVEVRIYELYTPGQFFPATVRVDQGGAIHVPELGSVPAAGLTVPQLQQELIERLAKKVMKNPTVSVNLVEGGAMTYVLYGHINHPGRFTLQDPTLRLLDALAMADGVPLSTRRVYVVRQVAVGHELKPAWHQPGGGASSASKTSTKSKPPVDIESLINQLQNDDKKPSQPAKPSPGVWAKTGDPPIDVEDVSPASVKLPTVEGAGKTPGHESSPFLYLPDKKQWVRSQPSTEPAAEATPNAKDLVVERVIEVPYQRLAHGDTSLNLIIRPGDQVYVDGPPTGYVYISGEINAPNAYPLPAADPLTLSRFIAMAGGLGALAIPDRVDLVRQVDEGREATIRLNLGAIRRRTEPDVIMKPNDHVLVGTNWFAYPLAVIRNGLRVNYGFGFLLDRNFGNDVFGPPPTNVRF
ncbi:MAG: polysaccharide biosynthesis/export family protein [Phycisphaerales bacterium]|nr:polysaccharide biosynthesis/export family protein [Phycisphaerales bacterium]